MSDHNGLFASWLETILRSVGFNASVTNPQEGEEQLTLFVDGDMIGSLYRCWNAFLDETLIERILSRND